MNHSDVHAFLLHGMGRTPCSMFKLALHLRRHGIKTHQFGYVPAFETWSHCLKRLTERINSFSDANPHCVYVLIGHSLGTVLIRGALPHVDRPPLACFLLASPAVACLLARKFSSNVLYRLVCGDMGQRLADPEFMASLPIPKVPTCIYAGTKGLTGRFSPFGTEENDTILKVSETSMPDIETYKVRAIHTLIMRSSEVIRDIVARIRLRG